MTQVIELRDGTKIGDGCPAFVVAELGQNHNGDAYRCLRMIKAAREAGADAVKLTKRDLASEMTAESAAAPYDNPHSYGPTYGEHRAALELSIEEYEHLKERIRYNEWEDTVFFATVCDVRSAIDIEERINPPLYKIASRDIDNIPLLQCVAMSHKPVILSTGMQPTRQELTRAIETIREMHDKIIVCACVSMYPTPDHLVRLDPVRWLREEYGVLAGWSDHTVGIYLSQAAVQAGACLVEKHFTLARAGKGTDHAASLEPAGFERLVRNIRGVENAMRRDTPRIDVSAARAKLGRSLVTRRSIPAGEVISEGDVCLKSPGTGISWENRHQVVGQTSRRSLPADVMLSPHDVFPQPVEA